MAKSFKIDVSRADNFVGAVLDGTPILHAADQSKSADFTNSIREGVEHTLAVVGINNAGAPNGDPYDFNYRISLDYNGNTIGIGGEHVSGDPGNGLQMLCMFHEYKFTFEPRRNRMTIKTNIDGAKDERQVELDKVPSPKEQR